MTDKALGTFLVSWRSGSRNEITARLRGVPQKGHPSSLTRGAFDCIIYLLDKWLLPQLGEESYTLKKEYLDS